MIKKLPIKPYKHHKGEIRQYGYKGRALTGKEQAIIFKINEIITQLNIEEQLAE